MPDAPNEIQTLVDEIKKGWKQRVLLQGSALSLLALLGAALLLLMIHLAFRLSPTLLMTGSALAALAVLAVAVQFLLRPYFRPLSDRKMALYVEERIPELEDRLNSAIEVETLDLPDQVRSELIDRLLDDAARQAASIPVTSIVDHQQVRRLAYGAGMLLFLFLIGGYLALDDLRIASTRPAGTFRLAASAPLMAVSPGNVEIEQGSSQAVKIRLRERHGQAVTLYYRNGQEGDWQKIKMQKKPGEETYAHEFLSVQQPIQYFAELGEQRSDPYTISLYNFPEVQQIDLTYSYPSYTGQPTRTEENTGDIRGLKGASVTVQVATSGSVKNAELVVNEKERIPLEAASDGRFTTSFPLKESGSYYVHLADEAGKENKFPIDYRIDPLPDERPSIELTAPRRDVRAHPVEEIQVAADVRDDYGLKNAQITYSVNGGEEQSISLLDQPAPPPLDTSGAHRFFLENLQLQPGDIISYYVEAADYAPEAEPEATDMYFIEVIPFEQRFRQANSQGGGGGGQQQSGTVLNQQQIITATWKLQRQRSELSESEFRSSLEAIEQGQANLKSNIEERISNTAFSLELRSDEKSRQVVRFLRKATTHMEAALDHLKSARLDDALTPEKKALNQLLKADALNKERQVALNRQRSGGGGTAAEDRMTELADLELNVSEDKYETRQQRSSAPQDRQLDDALQKLKELSRKQEDLLRKGQQQTLQGVDKKRMVDRLKRDQNELKKQTEEMAQALRRMARDNQQMSPRSEEQLQRASENMRRAEQAMQRGNTQQAQSRQQQALNDLNRLKKELQQQRSNSARATRQQLAHNFEKIHEREEQLRHALDDAASNSEGQQEADNTDLQRMQSSRQEAIEQLRQLKEQLESLQQQRDQSQQEGSAAGVRKVAEDLQREELARQMQASQQALERGDLEKARQQQGQIASALQRLEKSMQQLSQEPASKEEQMARDLATLRELKKQLEEQTGRAGATRRSSSQQSSSRPSTAQGDPESHLRRQIEEARQSLQRMQSQLEGNPSAQRQARRLQQALRADRTGELLNDGAADDYFNKRVYEPLTELELEMARQLNALQMKRKIYGARRDDVPTAYRDLVDKYYESLAK